ncbi:unnamed protein product [Amoebophrya sp. A120]|nr:unnamed protein product [Amoebophrya sp. A120]|eukprot:GSA120T00019062001.1
MAQILIRSTSSAHCPALQMMNLYHPDVTWPRPAAFHHSTSSSTSFLPAEAPAPDLCAPGGTIVKSTRDVLGGAAKVSYGVCYEPSGPSDVQAHLKCDPDSFHQRRKKLQCCRQPKLLMPNGESSHDSFEEHAAAKKQKKKQATMCADTSAEYTREGTLRYTSGTTCTPEAARDQSSWGRWFFSRGCQANTSSFFKPMPASEEACRGEQGAMILRKDLGEERLEFCPAGTQPIKNVAVSKDAKDAASSSSTTAAPPPASGRPFHSWECTGGQDTILQEEFCCNVNGKERCVGAYEDNESAPGACSCDLNQTPTNLAEFL